MGRNPPPAFSDESGITIVEILIAAIVLTVSALAILGMADSATRTTYRSEEGQVVVNRLQDEMERIRQLPFNEVALTSQPTRSTAPGSPAQRVSVDGTHFDLNRNGTDPKLLAYAGGATPDGEDMGCGGAGQSSCGISPGPEEFQSGDVSGKIYRYVVYPGVPADCTGCSADYFKQIIVAIRLDTTPAGGTHAYQEIQSNVSSPDAVPSSNPTDPTQTTDHQIATFWLTDTPCNNTARIPPASDHATHNTRGRCSDGGQTDATRGAPDLMVTDPPTESETESTYDYSTDVNRNETPRFGLAMLRTESAPGCVLQPVTGIGSSQTLDFPSVEATPQLKMHSWVSNELGSTFAALTTADATLELWTKSLGGAAYQGNLCVYVFKRVIVNQHIVGLPDSTFVVDAPATIDLAQPYLEIQRATWPQEWAKISTGKVDLTMLSVDEILNDLQGAGIPGTLSASGARLGVGLSVERAGTTGDALDVMYDTQTFDSRFELDTPRNTCVIPCP